MQTIEKNTREWWEELSHLAGLLKQWEANRKNEELGKRVIESMERLGFILPGTEKPPYVHGGLK